MKIFFSVGEPSGDLHGANLIRQLRKRRDDLELVGYGGPEMAAAGCHLHADLTQLAVMWFLRVLLNLHKFVALLWRADRYFRTARPDAVVLIDYPGFNWWIARRAKAHGIPVFYYGAPQLWAWAGWRIKKMRRFVDHVLCKLPFEEKWYRDRGCRATHIGHPFFDEVRRYELDATFLETHRDASRPLVTILPGSRTQEVKQNLKWFLKATAIVARRVPSARFAVAAFSQRHAQLVHQAIDAGEGLPEIEVFVKRTPELIHLATCCMAVSGSVSLELLYHTKPTVILYWISRTAHFVQNYMRKVKYITLVNLLVTNNLRRTDRSTFDPRAPGAEPVLFPEYLTCEDRSEEIAGFVTEWLTDEPERRRITAELAQLKDRVGAGGASQRGADYILRHLDQGRVPPRRPHFLSEPVGSGRTSKRRDERAA